MDTEVASPTPPRKLTKYLKRASITLCALALLLVCVVQFENWRGQRVWERVRTETTNQGIHLNWEDFIPEPIPDDQNLALAPVFAYWQYHDNDATPVTWQDAWGPVDELSTLANELRNAAPLDLDASSAAQLSEQLAPYTQLLSDIRQACNTRPLSRLNGDYATSPFDGPMLHFSSIRNYGSLLWAQAILAIQQGDAELALENTAAIQRLGQLSQKPYYLVTTMIQVVLERKFIVPIYAEAIRAGAFSDEELQSIIQDCLESDLLGNLERSYRSEIAGGTHNAADVIRKSKQANHIALLNNDESVPPWLFPMVPDGWILIQFSRVLRYHSMLLAPFDVPNRRFDLSQLAANNAIFDEVISSPDWFNRLAAMSLPAFEKVQDYTIEIHQLKDMCGIAAALELYRRETQQLPEQLDQLVPQYLPILYHDPLTGANYHYQCIDDTNYRLWSVGLDLTNDGGNRAKENPLDVVWPLSAALSMRTPEPWLCSGNVVTESAINNKWSEQESETVSVDFPDESVRVIVRDVADLFDLNLVIPETLTKDIRTSVKLRDMTWPNVFDVLLEPVGYTWYRRNGIIYIISLDEAADIYTDTTAHVENLDQANLQPLLEQLQLDGILQRVGSCADSSHIHFNAHIAYATEIKALIESLDATGYQLRKPEPEDLVLMLPDAESGTISVDYSNHSVYEIIQDVSQLRELTVHLPEALKDTRTSIRLRGIIWEQVFEVVLEPVGYAYYQDNDSIHIVTREVFDALPLIPLTHRCIFITPDEFINYHGSNLQPSRHERFEVRGATLIIHAHPGRVAIWKERLESSDDIRGLPRFPGQIYWPDEIPVEALRPNKDDNRALGFADDLNATDTRVFILDWIDATKIELRLTPLLKNKGEAIQVDRRSNSIVATARTETLQKIAAACRYLDQRKWYLPPAERVTTSTVAGSK